MKMLLECTTRRQQQLSSGELISHQNVQISVLSRRILPGSVPQPFWGRTIGDSALWSKKQKQLGILILVRVGYVYRTI